MKLNLAPRKHRRAHLAAAALGGLLLAAGAALGAPFDSPAGTAWDCVMSGPREGLARFIFSAPTNAASPGVFDVDEIIVTKAPHVATADTQRGNAGDTGRTPTSPNTNSLPAHTDIFGGESATSLWGFDNRGRVVGYFYEITPPVYTTNTQVLLVSNFTSPGPITSTNYISGLEFVVTLPSLSTTNITQISSNQVPVGPVSTNEVVSETQTNPNPAGYCLDIPIAGSFATNSPDAVTWTNQVVCYAINGFWTNVATYYTNIVTASAITNQVSFSATVSPGRRLVLVASTPAGKVTYSGVPDVALPDIGGSYYASERVGLLQYYEFLTLTPWSQNTYTVSGSGPGYTYYGMAFLWPQKKLALDLGIYPVFPVGSEFGSPPQSIRAVVGSANLRKFSAALHGLQAGSGNTNDLQHLTFTLYHQ